MYTFDKILQCFPVSPIFTLFTEFALSSLNNFHSHNIFYPICHRLTQSDIQREQIGLGTTFAGWGGKVIYHVYCAQNYCTHLTANHDFWNGPVLEEIDWPGSDVCSEREQREIPGTWS